MMVFSWIWQLRLESYISWFSALKKFFEDNQTSHLICGDSLVRLKDIPNSSVNCIITSPPYWALRDYGIKEQIGMELILSDYLDNLVAVFMESFRILKPDGTLWLNIGDSYTSGNRKYRAPDRKNKARSLSSRPDNPIGLKNKDLIGIPWRLAFKLQEKGWFLRSEIIWHKLNAMPESVKDRLHRNHEHLFLFSKSEKYFFDIEALVKENLNFQSVWSIKQGRYNGGHHATFPEDIVLPCIVSSTKVNDIVLDPFCGSGTVGVVAKDRSRRFLGVDINPNFIELAIDRISQKDLIMC